MFPSIPSLEVDSMLNVHVKCAGCVVMYFNGRLTRFNLEESFDTSWEAIPLHDGLFHIILSSVGALADKNAMVL